MIILKLILTWIAVFMFAKSRRSFLRQKSPLNFMFMLLSIVLFAIAWFDEATSGEQLQANPIISYIDLNFIIIAIVTSLFFLIIYTTLVNQDKRLDHHITQLVRKQAITDKTKL